MVDSRRVHFVEADMKADGARHEEVVVFAYDSSESAVWFTFVGEVFIEASEVAFDVEVFADDAD